MTQEQPSLSDLDHAPDPMGQAAVDAYWLQYERDARLPPSQWSPAARAQWKRHNAIPWIMFAVCFAFIAAVSFASAPGIQPAWGLTPGGAYVIVMATGAWFALVSVICATVGVRNATAKA